MIPTRMIIVSTAAAVGLGVTLAHAEDIALSLVNPAGRIDIPASAIKSVEALEKKTFRNTETVSYMNLKMSASRFATPKMSGSAFVSLLGALSVSRCG